MAAPMIRARWYVAPRGAVLLVCIRSRELVLFFPAPLRGANLERW